VCRTDLSFLVSSRSFQSSTMAKGKARVRKPRTRNPELVRGVRKVGRVVADHRQGKWKFTKKGLGKNKPHVTPARADKLEGKFYAADDTKVALRSQKAKAKTPKLRKSLRSGTIAIILSGRFRGKRVVVLKQLKKSGMLLVCGPYKVNGVPLRRVNPAYVIATSTTLDVSKVDVKKIDDGFFVHKKAKVAASKDGEAFFNKASDKKKSPVEAARKAETSRVGKELLVAIKAVPEMKKYLNAKFTLTRGNKPHAMKF